MKVYVILESFADYKSGNATSFGVFKTVFKTKESAIKHLPDAIIESFGYETIEDWEDNYGDCFENYMSTDREYWRYDSDDYDIMFHIQEDELED